MVKYMKCEHIWQCGCSDTCGSRQEYSHVEVHNLKGGTTMSNSIRTYTYWKKGGISQLSKKPKKKKKLQYILECEHHIRLQTKNLILHKNICIKYATSTCFFEVAIMYQVIYKNLNIFILVIAKVCMIDEFSKTWFHFNI